MLQLRILDLHVLHVVFPYYRAFQCTGSSDHDISALSVLASHPGNFWPSSQNAASTISACPVTQPWHFYLSSFFPGFSCAMGKLRFAALHSVVPTSPMPIAASLELPLSPDVFVPSLAFPPVLGAQVLRLLLLSLSPF